MHLALLEIGAPYHLELVDFERDAQHSPEYLKLNPGGTVPALAIDGQVRVESGALLLILAERHPEAQLIPPAGTPERELWQQWVVYLSNTLMSAYRLWFYPRELGYDDYPPAIRAAIQRRIESVWDRLEAQLSAHGPYLLGEQFSGADLMLTMYDGDSDRLCRIFSLRAPKPISSFSSRSAPCSTVSSWSRRPLGRLNS